MSPAPRTRAVTGKLLAHFGIENRLERCDENVIAAKSPALVSRMLDGEEVAFCSDAGMPGISDPGCVLVDAAREAGVPVDVLPGPSAVTTALVTSGFKYNAFYFGGFLPRKEADRAALLESLANLGCRARLLRVAPSRHRITASIAQAYGARPVALCRELTKLHEEVLRLPADELAANLAARDAIKGEIALVIAPPDVRAQQVASLDDPALRERIAAELTAGTPKSALAKQLAREFGLPKNKLYEFILSFPE